MFVWKTRKIVSRPIIFNQNQTKSIQQHKSEILAMRPHRRMRSVPIPIKVSTSFSRRSYVMSMSTSESDNLNDLYDRVPQQSISEMAQNDEEFFKFRASEKSKLRSWSLPPNRGKFVLLNRRMNTSPTEKKRSD